MSVPVIPASTPVSQPATEALVFDKWFLSELMVHATPDKAPLRVVLKRANLTNETWTLMSGPGSTNLITLDVWQEAANSPDIANALGAIMNAIIAYGTAKKLL